MSLAIPDGLDLIRRTSAENQHLAVLITAAVDSVDPQVSVVNAAVVADPVSASQTVGLVARAGAKMANLRARPRATLVFQAGWQWVSVRGPVSLHGPDDLQASIDDAALRQLLRDIYHAAGGQHQDLAEYDRAMLDERRCAVLVTPERIWSNPPGTEHKERNTP